VLKNVNLRDHYNTLYYFLIQKNSMFTEIVLTKNFLSTCSEIIVKT
jgi:hypothetical protein